MPLSLQLIEKIEAKLANQQLVFNTEASSNYVCVLDTRGVLAISGPDSEKFLQGQLTCDVSTISPSRSSLGAHCTPKGRALASFRLINTGEHHYLFGLPHNNLNTLKASLGKYIVFSKASLEEADGIITLGISGDKATQFIRSQFATALVQHESVSNDSGIAVCIDTDRYELWLSEAQLLALWPQLSSQLTPSSKQAWDSANIAAEIVEIEAATSDEFIPQMFKLDAHDGISFTKGCYTGQEIVARLKYLGKQKRQLCAFTHNSSHIEIGAAIENSDGSKLGNVVAIAANSGLAVISDKALEANQPQINSEAIQLAHGE